MEEDGSVVGFTREADGYCILKSDGYCILKF